MRQLRESKEAVDTLQSQLRESNETVGVLQSHVGDLSAQVMRTMDLLTDNTVRIWLPNGTVADATDTHALKDTKITGAAAVAVFRWEMGPILRDLQHNLKKHLDSNATIG